MKRIFALLLAMILCVSLCACGKSDTEKTGENTAKTECTEQTIRELIEKNLDCYFIFYVSPITTTTQQNSDGYLGTETNVMENYAALENLVNSTYTAEKSKELLSYPSADLPLYKNVDGLIFEYPDAIKPVEYKIIWDDYSIKITSSTKEKCTFTATTVDFDSKAYTTNGEVVFENEKWLLSDLVY